MHLNIIFFSMWNRDKMHQFRIKALMQLHIILSTILDWDHPQIDAGNSLQLVFKLDIITQQMQTECITPIFSIFLQLHCREWKESERQIEQIEVNIWQQQKYTKFKNHINTLFLFRRRMWPNSCKLEACECEWQTRYSSQLLNGIHVIRLFNFMITSFLVLGHICTYWQMF